MRPGGNYEITIWGVPFKFPHVEPTRLGPHFHGESCATVPVYSQGGLLYAYNAVGLL